MRLKNIFFLLLLFIFIGVTICAAEVKKDPLDRALSDLQLTRASLQVDPTFMTLRSTATRWQLPIFDVWFNHPSEIPFWESQIRTGLHNSEGRLHNLQLNSASLLGWGTRRELIPPSPAQRIWALAQEPNALENAIHSLDSSAIIPDVSQLPISLQHSIAAILFGANNALQWRNEALRKLSAVERDSLYHTLAQPSELPKSITDTMQTSTPQFEVSGYHWLIDHLDEIDYRSMMAGADDFTATIDMVLDSLPISTTKQSFQFSCKTRYGWIEVNGSNSDNYIANRHYLLIFDTGGDDIYETGGCTSSAELPIGITINLAGNDTYRNSTRKPAFGAGILGYGFLIDAEGNDHYISDYYSLGSGVAGSGILCDYSGDDSYRSISSAQGFGFCGTGVLADKSGNDRYEAFVQSQACGLPQGTGLLIDLAGDDHYIANDSLIEFPSAQTKEHNSSMCQGAGFGFRRDFIDGQSVAGGFAFLYDAAGNDEYFGGVFAQAVGYWYGIGVVDDNDGNDSYRGVWYNQSATAHFGVSYIHDRAGDDRYKSLMTMAMGAAHDFSVSLLFDEHGNDRYDAASNAVGRSLNSSVALFVDQSGDDWYSVSANLGECLNESSIGIRAAMASIAIFLDLDGNDKYLNTKFLNGKSRIQTVSAPLPKLYGIGADINQSSPLRWR